MRKTPSLPNHPENTPSLSDAASGPQAPISSREIWFESDGCRLFAVETGQGRPVVFVHGGLADHRAVLFRLGKVAARCRLIAPDLRGSGRSRHAGELDWDRLADDLAALLSHLGLASAVVGGVSMGSAVALRFALRYPRMLDALILMSPLYPGADRPLAPASTAAMRVMAEAGERCIHGGIDALRFLFEALPLPARGAALAMLQGFDPKSVAATTRFLATNAQPMRSASDLTAINVPVMLLPGIDRQHPAEIGELYARYLRHPLVVEQTQPDWAERVAAFCAGCTLPEK